MRKKCLERIIERISTVLSAVIAPMIGRGLKALPVPVKEYHSAGASGISSSDKRNRHHSRDNRYR